MLSLLVNLKRIVLKSQKYTKVLEEVSDNHSQYYGPLPRVGAI